LIDDIGHPLDACKYAAKLANLSRPTVVRYEEPPPSLLGLLARSPMPASKAGTGAGVTINGVEVKAGPETLDALRTHRLLYR
jgi:hypothetical protein